MALLNRPNEEPPDGWIYTQPETGGRWKQENLHQLIGVVRDHRIYKGLKPDDYASVRLDIERQICSGMPEGICSGEAGENYVPFDDRIRGISMDDLLAFSQASFRFIASGGATVDKATSKRRADICRGCRFNRPSPCVVCTPVFKVMDAAIPEDRKEPGLSACGICGCSLRAKVLLPLNTIRDADQAQKFRFPPHCWIAQEEMAYIHGEKEKGIAQGQVSA